MGTALKWFLMVDLAVLSIVLEAQYGGATWYLLREGVQEEAGSGEFRLCEEFVGSWVVVLAWSEGVGVVQALEITKQISVGVLWNSLDVVCHMRRCHLLHPSPFASLLESRDESS